MNIHMQIAGPMNKEVSLCLGKLASIHFKFGDVSQAVQMQSKCVLLNEQLYGHIHPHTASSYFSLALYSHTVGNAKKAFEQMHRALYILHMICGGPHPEISSIYTNLGLMYSEIEHHSQAIESFNQALEINKSLFGEDHIQVAYSFQSIASAYSGVQDYRKALEYQQQSHQIVQKHYKKGDPLFEQSHLQLNDFLKLSVIKEKAKTVDKTQKRPNQAMKFKPAQFSQEAAAANGQLPQWFGMGQEGTEGQEKVNQAQMSQLLRKMAKGKPKNFLDVLEYNYFKEQQSKEQGEKKESAPE